MRTLLPFLAAAALCAAGCPSAYQKTYDEEMRRLEAQEEMRLQQEEAQRQEARKYVAVVLFALNSAVIDEAGYRELDWFLDKIRPYPNVHIEVKGYTDSSGGEAHNQPLSEERAWAVHDFLVDRGVRPDHVSASGFGSSAPAESNVTGRGRRQNRRAEVRVR